MASKPTYEELEQKVWKLEEEATEYKQTEQALRRERDKVQKYLDVAGAIIVVIGANQKVSLINRRGCEVLGYEANEIQGKNWFDNFLPERVKEDLRSGFIELMAAPQKDIKEIFEDGGENPILTKGGKERIIAWRNTVLKDEEGNITATMSSGEDVTEARRAEKALRESENKYRTLLESIPQKIFHKDRHSVYVSCNENYARDLMIKPEEIAGKTDYEFFPKELAEKYRADDKRIITSGKTENIEEKYIQDGQEIWVQTAKTPVKDEKGNVTGILGIFWDITQRKRAEEALQRARDELEIRVKDRTAELSRSNALLKQEIAERKRAEEALRKKAIDLDVILANMGQGIAYLDGNDTIIYLNKQCSELFGLEYEDVLGKNIYEFHAPEKTEKIKRLINEFRNGKQSLHFIETLYDRFIDNTFHRIENAEGSYQGILMSAFDITERVRAEEQSRKLEAQFQQAQKLEAIGTLSGGIAHDFNNLLMAIQSNAFLVLIDLDSTHPYYEPLANIKDLVTSGAELTRQLLGYARKGRYHVKPINLNQLVEKTSETIRRTRKDIVIVQDLAENLFAIEADQGQIEQVLMNLFVNASDTMPVGGYLTLKTMNVTHKDMEGKLFDPKPGNYVRLTVTDTGKGMDKETMERIFEPFYTTKEMGRGTGLGLASVYGIIKGHGGYIDVESEPGHGTTFTVYLPTTEKKVEETVKPSEEIVKGTETILMVDDEERVLDAGVMALKSLGYTVLEASGGREAVEIYKENRDRIDLVILDMVMPHMGGGEAYDKMKEINPKVKVLLSSGYSIDGQAKEILARGCDAFMQKPFGMRELSQKIRGVLQKEKAIIV